MNVSDWTIDQQSELAARILSGDRSAENELVLMFAPKVLAMLIARTRDREASRDLLQEVLLAVIQALRSGQLRDPSKVAGFIHGIARNMVGSHLRRRGRDKREDPLTPDIARVAAHDLQSEVENAAREDLIRQSLELLEPVDREILLATMVDNQKPGQIASRTGMNSELVRQRKSRAIKKIIEFVQKASRIPR